MSTTVVVDAWHLGGFSANRGIGTYLRHVLAGLGNDPQLRVIALATDQTELPPRIERHSIWRTLKGRFAHQEHDLRLPRDLARAMKDRGDAVVLSPADNPPRRSPGPWVQMMHDLIPLAVPDPVFGSAAARWRRLEQRISSADAIITNSRSTARDVIQLLHADVRRVHIAHLGVDSSFRPPSERRPADPPTILYVGEYGPHKGFAEAFGVIDELAEAGLPHRLAMVGYLAPWHEPVVRSLLASANHPERVDLRGYVDDLVDMYQQADAVIVTSRYEGFCLPAVEAMACGTPVVAFDNSALTEVLGNGGTLIADGDVLGMVRALRTLLGDAAVWSDASARGRERARCFSWNRCVDAHSEILRAVAG